MLDYEPYLKQKFSNWVIFVFEDGKTFGSDNFKEKDYFKYVSGKVTLYRFQGIQKERCY